MNEAKTHALVLCEQPVTAARDSEKCGQIRLVERGRRLPSPQLGERRTLLKSGTRQCKSHQMVMRLAFLGFWFNWFK